LKAWDTLTWKDGFLRSTEAILIKCPS